MNEVKKKDNSGCWWFLVILGISILVALSDRDGSSSINTKVEDPFVTCQAGQCDSVFVTRSRCLQLVCCNSLFAGNKMLTKAECDREQAEDKKALLIMEGYSNRALKGDDYKFFYGGEKSYSGDYYSGSGHDAGYDWASQQDLDSTSSCTGNSDSFIEGCWEYVCEMAEFYPDDYECF